MPWAGMEAKLGVGRLLRVLAGPGANPSNDVSAAVYNFAVLGCTFRYQPGLNHSSIM